MSMTLLAVSLLHPWLGPVQAEVPADRAVILEAASGLARSLPVTELELAGLAEAGAALVRFEGFAPPPPLVGEELVEVEFADGRGHATALLLGGEEEDLHLRLSGGSRLTLAIEDVAALRAPARVPLDWTGPIVASEEGDRLYRSLGAGLDRIDGTLEGFDAQGVQFETRLGSKHFDWDEVAAFFVEVFDEEPPPAEGEEIEVDLVDGSRLTGSFRRLTQEGLELVTPGGRGLRLPLGAVAEVFLRGAGLAFLSDLEPVESPPSSPFDDDLGMTWPARRDRSTTGAALTAGGRVWTRGLGVHAPSRVVYALDGAWSGLRGSVAIDDEVIPLPARGSVVFKVLGDGELLWESPVVHGGDPPLALPVLDLGGVERLALEVDMADELHLGDRADWLRMVLVR